MSPENEAYSGDIILVASLEDGTELEIGIVPEPGQTIYEVEVPDELRELSPREVY